MKSSVEFFQKCNSRGGWNKNVLAGISGGTYIRPQRVRSHSNGKSHEEKEQQITGQSNQRTFVVTGAK